MKVDDKQPGVISLARSHGTKTMREPQPSPPAPTDDSVELSSVRKADTLTPLLQDHPEIRTDRVDDLKRRIDAGDYQVPGTKVAKKMIAKILRDKRTPRDE